VNNITSRSIPRQTSKLSVGVHPVHQCIDNLHQSALRPDPRLRLCPVRGTGPIDPRVVQFSKTRCQLPPGNNAGNCPQYRGYGTSLSKRERHRIVKSETRLNECGPNERFHQLIDYSGPHVGFLTSARVSFASYSSFWSQFAVTPAKLRVGGLPERRGHGGVRSTSWAIIICVVPRAPARAQWTIISCPWRSITSLQ